MARPTPRRNRLFSFAAFTAALIALTTTSSSAATNLGGGATVSWLTYSPGYEPGPINDSACYSTSWELDGDIAQLNVAFDNNAYAGPASLYVLGSGCGNVLQESGYLVELDIAGYPLGVQSSFSCSYLGGDYQINNGRFTLTASGDCVVDGTTLANESVTITAAIAPYGALTTGPWVDYLTGHIGFSG
jgi:hypothetical protein